MNNMNEESTISMHTTVASEWCSLRFIPPRSFDKLWEKDRIPV